jgi:predicted ATPase/class 3 adenylate cyclase
VTSLPSGTVAFLMSDIEGSTRLAAAAGSGFPALLDEHFALLRAAIEGSGGTIVSTEGDSVFAVLPTARAAIAAAVDGQRALTAHDWPEGRAVHVRVGIHVGEAVFGGRDYTGIDVHHAARVMAAAWGDEIVATAAVQALASAALPPGVTLRDLGVHALRDIAEPQRLYQVVASGLRADFPPPRTESAAARTNLPVPLTRFVGRARELAEVQALLADARLVTLTGPGGTGKTRLAIEVARASLTGYPDGVFFVALDAVRDPDLVVPQIAQTLGLVEEAGRPIAETLAAYLVSKRMLLVLDNLEQVISAAPRIAELVGAAPNLTILGSSREPLGVAGEQVYPVPALGLPQEPGHPSAAQVAAMDSVQLFVERAQAVRPGFNLDDDNAPAVAAICRRVDGLPLAIELAAARVNVLTPAQILERLDHRLTLLAGSRRDVTDRQRTLRGAIEWSYDLLDDDEKAAFRRFSAFSGGADLDAVLAVVDPDQNLKTDALDLLGALVSRSLIVSAANGPAARFTMLETIREYAFEQLRATPEGDTVCGRHSAYYATLAEGAAEVLFAPDRDARLDGLELEMANFRAAIEWSMRHGDAARAARFTGLNDFWRTRSHLGEARRLLDQMLETAVAVGDQAAESRILGSAAELASWATDYTRGAELSQRHIALLTTLGDRGGLAAALQNVAWSSISVAPQIAHDYFARSVEIGRELGDDRALLGAYQGLAMTQFRLGDLAGARASATMTTSSGSAARDRYTNSYNIMTLGAIELVEGNWAEAARDFTEAFDRAQQASSQIGLVVTLEAIAHFALEVGDITTGVKIATAADRLRAEIGGAPSVGLIGWAPTEELARARDSAATEAAQNEARAMTTADAIALARAVLARYEA